MIKKHVNTEDHELVIFGVPDCRAHELVFSLSKRCGTLTVDGDYGLATYSFRRGGVCLESIANSCSSHIVGKMRSSEYEKYDWCGDKVREFIESYIEELEDDERKKEVQKEWKDSYVDCDDKWEWIFWCRDNAEDVFQDQDAWEWFYSVGNVLSVYPQIHIFGLKEAFKLINKEEKTNAV